MTKLLQLVPDKFSEVAKIKSDRPLEDSNLQGAAKAMLSLDFTLMVYQAVQKSQLLGQLNRGLIALMHKGSDREDLGNWSHITL